MKKRNSILFLFIIAVSGVLYAAEKGTLILHHADYNRNTMRSGKLISNLKGNVAFEYNKTVIESDRAVWYRSRGDADFYGNVEVHDSGKVLTCNRMKFVKSRDEITAMDKLFFADSTESMEIRAGKGVYNLEQEVLNLTIEPEVKRFSEKDTMILTGRRMVYDDSASVITIIKDVRILQGDLIAVCDMLHYNVENETAKLRMEPDINFTESNLAGDSVDLFFEEKSLRGISVTGNSSGIHRDPDNGDTTETHLFGDSLYIAVDDSGQIDTLWAYSNASAEYFSVSDTADKVFGRMMRLDFNEEGSADELRVIGNAVCDYRIDDSDGVTLSESSGDSLFVSFFDGRAEYLELKGGVRGSHVGLH